MRIRGTKKGSDWTFTALLLASCITFAIGPPSTSYLLVGPSTTATCILGSHIFLNLRLQMVHSDVDVDIQSSANGSVFLKRSESPGPRRRDVHIVIPLTRIESAGAYERTDLSDAALSGME